MSGISILAMAALATQSSPRRTMAPRSINMRMTSSTKKGLPSAFFRIAARTGSGSSSILRRLATSRRLSLSDRARSSISVRLPPSVSRAAVTSRHAGAYWRLATDWAALLASFRPEYQDVAEPIAERRCLLCHTTVAQDPDALLARSFRVTEGVGCETCHGAGSLYIDEEVMKDRGRFLAAGGLIPDEKTCRKCHRNAERFDFETWWPKISHKERPQSQSGATHGEEN